MTFGMYSIRDQLVGFSQPSIAVNDDVAIRNFGVLVNDDKGTMVNAQPQYYDLYKVAEFDDESGSITPLSPIQLLVTGLSVRKDDSDEVSE